MLVLTRRDDEQLEITVSEPCKIILTAVECCRGRVRIGIDAPMSARVSRRELKNQAVLHCHLDDEHGPLRFKVAE